MELNIQNLEIYNYNISYKYIHLTANKYYKERDTFNALILYEQLLNILVDDNIRSLLYSNKAACYLILKDYINVLQNALESIKHNNTNSKAWGRIGWAFKALKKHDKITGRKCKMRYMASVNTQSWAQFPILLQMLRSTEEAYKLLASFQQKM